LNESNYPFSDFMLHTVLMQNTACEKICGSNYLWTLPSDIFHRLFVAHPIASRYWRDIVVLR